MSDVARPIPDDEPDDEPDDGPADGPHADRPLGRLDPGLETPVADALDQRIEVPPDEESRA